LLGASWRPCRRLADRKSCNASLLYHVRYMASITRSWLHSWSRFLVAQLTKKYAVCPTDPFLRELRCSIWWLRKFLVS
jgi:hypothetical protein